MARRPKRCALSGPSSTFFLGVVLAACGESSTTGAQPSHEAGLRGSGGSQTVGDGGRSGDRTGSGGANGGAAGLADGGASGVDCNQNRGPGIPVNSGTLSAAIEGQTVSGPGTLLWTAPSNTLSLESTDGSSLVVIFPGCSAQTYSVPEEGGTTGTISITYTGAGGDPQWACLSGDPVLGPANCTVDVTAYGREQNAPVTGTFSGVLRLRRGTGTSTKSVTAGTFTFGRP